MKPQPSANATIEQPGAPASISNWDKAALTTLLNELATIHATLDHLASEFQELIEQTNPVYRRSATNLVHYLALRRHDVRQLQEKLAGLGLSSLGRSESHVKAALDAVLRIMHRLVDGVESDPAEDQRGTDFLEGKALLRAHTEALLGPQPGKRSVRIMVTMPSEAAVDYSLVRQLVAGGMDCMRINCAHDDPQAWAGMVANLRRAERELSTHCQLQMDLGGPKVRTGSIDPTMQAIKWRPQRDEWGNVLCAARISVA